MCWKNASSYVDPTSYSSTYYNPADYQMKAGYQSNFRNDTNSATYSADYQQQYTQCAGYYPPGRPYVPRPAASTDCPAPAYWMVNSQPPPPGPTAWGYPGTYYNPADYQMTAGHKPAATGYQNSDYSQPSNFCNATYSSQYQQQYTQWAGYYPPTTSAAICPPAASTECAAPAWR